MSAPQRSRQDLILVVDLDERGWFKAHVEEDQSGRSVFAFSNENEETGWPSEAGLWIVEDGYMRHGRDTAGLLEYLRQVAIASPSASMRVKG